MFEDKGHVDGKSVTFCGRLRREAKRALYVEAQARKCFVIAIRYSEGTDYRYLVASDLSWRTLDSVQADTLRRLLEMVIEDLKVHEGWGQATKQPGEEGSSRGLCPWGGLSLPRHWGTGPKAYRQTLRAGKGKSRAQIKD